MLKLGTTGVSTTYKKAYLGDNLVYDGYAGIKITPNSNNYTLNNSADGKNKGNIKIGDGPELNQVQTTGKNLLDYDSMTIGTVPSTQDGQDITVTGAAATDYIEVDNTKDYVFSALTISPAKYMFYYDENKDYLAKRQFTSSHSPVTGNLISDSTYWPNTKYVKFRTDTYVTDSYNECMLEQGSEKTTYELYSGGYASPSPN